MKATELIAKLQGIVDAHGPDLVVTVELIDEYNHRGNFPDRISDFRVSGDKLRVQVTEFDSMKEHK